MRTLGLLAVALLIVGCSNCDDGGISLDDAGRTGDAGMDVSQDRDVRSADTGSTADVATDSGPECGENESSCETDDGTVCCPAETACLFAACVPLGDPCVESTDCPFEAFCEPTVERCVDFDADPNACIFRPPVGQFIPVEAYSWTGSTVSPTYDQVMMAPMIANLTDDDGDGDVDIDDVPDIVFATFAGSNYNGAGILRVISGADGSEHWSSSEGAGPFDVRGGGTPALGDIDDDGIAEIVMEGGTAGGVYAIEHDGTVKWHQPAAVGTASGGPAIANIDGAGLPEIITRTEVLNASGDVVCSGLASSTTPVAADLDGDGTLEILMGTHIYRLVDATATDGSGCEQVRAGVGGYPAVADFDLDGDPEVVLAGGGTLRMVDHEGAELWATELPLDAERLANDHGIADCAAAPAGQACGSDPECGGSPGRCIGGTCVVSTLCLPGGGPPTVADFDGDGVPEIGIAGRWYYLVYEPDGTVLWAHRTKDFSSAATGSSVFDFEGDGRAEVVYNDELFLRVYSGAGAGVDADGNGFGDPEILLEIENSSGTLLEYPLIVDVDNDGSAEIVVAANDYAFGATKGVRVFKDAENRWVGTRPIWNQHAYSVTNIEDDGRVPQTVVSNWTRPRLNNFRQNVQGGNPLAAPNLTASIDDVDGASCSTSGISIDFTIRNEGSLGIRTGQLDVTVYAGREGQTLAPIVTLQNTMPLAPGGSESFSYTWAAPPELAGMRVDVRVVADDDGTGMGAQNECVEDDNEAIEMSVLCAVQQ